MTDEHHFADDGGTPAWRANQATWGPIIEAAPQNPVVRFIWRVRGVPFWRLLLFWLTWTCLAPLVFLFGGLLTAWAIGVNDGNIWPFVIILCAAIFVGFVNSGRKLLSHSRNRP